MAASGWQSGAEPKKKQTQAKMIIILVINVKLLASSVSIVQCSILNILVNCNYPRSKYDKKNIDGDHIVNMMVVGEGDDGRSTESQIHAES